MTDAIVLYDATHPSYPLGGWIVVVELIFLVAGLVLALRPRFGVRSDATADRAMGVFFILIAAVGFTGAGAPFFTSLHAQSVLRAGNTEITEGCVERYENQFHDHGVDTYFSIGAIPFHFEHNVWRPGFQNAAQVIRPGQRLKITRSDDFVLRVEVSPGTCPEHDAPTPYLPK